MFDNENSWTRETKICKNNFPNEEKYEEFMRENMKDLCEKI